MKIVTVTMDMITSYQISFILKVGIPQYDDKRFVMNDKINKLAHGHYEILF